MTKTLAAIPAYDEELAIGSIVLRCAEYVDEVLVIDDGSDDGTSDIAKLAKATVLRHTTNEGKGASIQSALKFALTNGFDAMVLLDGDGQHDPAYIPDLLKPVQLDQADIVLGVRRMSTSMMPVYRRAGQRILDFITAVGTKGTLMDSQSGFRALSRKAIESLDLEERAFAVESEMLIDAKDKNLRVAEVPIHARYDVEGSTKGPVSHGFGVVDRVLRIIAVRHPLLFFGIFGMGLVVAGILLGFLSLFTYARNPQQAIGYSFLVAICLIFGGMAIHTGIMLNVLPRAVARVLRGQENRE